MRKIFKKLHLWLSVPFGVLITIICLSGALLVFEREITECVDSELYKVEYVKGAEKLSPTELIAKVETQIPDTINISSIEIYGVPNRAAMVRYKGLSKKEALSVNPYNGEVLGVTEWKPFFRTMFFLHRFLMDAPQKRGEMPAGKFIVALSTIILLVISISGLIIWFPRRNSRNYNNLIKKRLKFSVNSGWQRFWHTTHLSWGVYTLLVVILMGLTGLTWSFSSVREVAYSLLGADKSEKAIVTPLHTEPHISTAESQAWNNAYSKLLTLYPEFKSITISNEKADVKPLVRSTHPFIKDSYKFDKSGNLTEVVYYKNQPMQYRAKGIIYTLHTGSFGAFFFKIIYFIIAIMVATLPISGYYLWIKRLKNISNRRES